MIGSAVTPPRAGDRPSSNYEEALQRLFERLGQLSSLPSAAQRLFEASRNEKSKTDDLVRVIEQDPTLAIRVLRSVNAPYFGLQTPCADLRTAVSLLGFVAIKNLALTVFVARLGQSKSEYKQFSRERLWRHMATTAAVARMISKICRRADPDEAYTAGLLHDLGFLLVDQYLNKQWRQVLDATAAGSELTAAETRLLSFDHAQLGGYLCEQCGLPDRVVTAVAFHHAPDRIGKRERELLDVVVLANFFTSRNGAPAFDGRQACAPTDAVCEGLGLERAQFVEIWRQLRPTLASAEALAAI